MKLLDASSRVGVPGIQNLGNTCFFNAILQALAAVASFQEFLQEIERAARATGHDIPFTRALRDCLQGAAVNEKLLLGLGLTVGGSQRWRRGTARRRARQSCRARSTPSSSTSYRPSAATSSRCGPQRGLNPVDTDG